jgi:hypothetical protein
MNNLQRLLLIGSFASNCGLGRFSPLEEEIVPPIVPLFCQTDSGKKVDAQGIFRFAFRNYAKRIMKLKHLSLTGMPGCLQQKTLVEGCV